MFGFNGIFATSKPRRFDYRPRYYDLEQEAREKRKREVLGTDYADKYKSEEDVRADYKPGAYVRNAAKTRRGIGTSASGNSVSTTRVLLVFLLIGAAIWLLTTDKLDIFFNTWLTK